MAITTGTWEQGRLLDTVVTRTFSPEQRAKYELEETQRIFTNFHFSDQGMGRRGVAFFENPDDAAYVIELIRLEREEGLYQKLKQRVLLYIYGAALTGMLIGFAAGAAQIWYLAEQTIAKG